MYPFRRYLSWPFEWRLPADWSEKPEINPTGPNLAEQSALGAQRRRRIEWISPTPRTLSSVKSRVTQPWT
jgi:hypothetical protein